MSLPESVTINTATGAVPGFSMLKRQPGEYYISGTSADQPQILKLTSKLNADGYSTYTLSFMRQKNNSNTPIPGDGASKELVTYPDPKMNIDLVVKARLGDTLYGFFTEAELLDSLAHMFSFLFQPTGTGLAFTASTTATRWLRGER